MVWIMSKCYLIENISYCGHILAGNYQQKQVDSTFDRMSYYKAYG